MASPFAVVGTVLLSHLCPLIVCCDCVMVTMVINSTTMLVITHSGHQAGVDTCTPNLCSSSLLVLTCCL